jgi:hypothetical protein
VRLFLRKDRWLRVANLGYADELSDIAAACRALCEKPIPFSDGPDDEQQLDLQGLWGGIASEGPISPMQAIDDTPLSCFAFDQWALEGSGFLDDMLSMLSLDELKVRPRSKVFTSCAG